MKGAWENFTVGIAGSSQDLSGLMDKLVDSVVTAGNNVVPRIQEIVNTITRAAPEVIRRFAEIIPQFAPMGIEIVKTLADGIGSQIPKLLELGSKAIGAISDGIVKYVPKAGEAITSFLTGIVDMIGRQSDKLVAAGGTIIESILSGFLSTVDKVSSYIGEFVTLIVQGFAAQHEALFSAGMDISGAIALLESLIGAILENAALISAIALDKSTLKRPMDVGQHKTRHRAASGAALREELGELDLLPRMNDAQKETCEHLKGISPDCTRGEWFNIGLDIWQVFGDDLGGDVFRYWSEPGESFNPQGCAVTWANIMEHGPDSHLNNRQWDAILHENMTSAF